MMSYILDAIKKAEQEREQGQLIDIKYESARFPVQFLPHLLSWLLMSILLGTNILLLTALLAPKQPLVPPTVYFISPLPKQSSIEIIDKKPLIQQSIETIPTATVVTNHPILNQEKLLSLNKIPIDF